MCCELRGVSTCLGGGGYQHALGGCMLGGGGGATCLAGGLLKQYNVTVQSYRLKTTLSK